LRKSREKPSEEDLLKMLYDRSEKGFSILYDNYSSSLYGVIFKILKKEELAEDVMQEAFVKIWNNINRYDKSKGTLFTFILNIARNLAIDKLRSAEFSNNNKTDSLTDYVGLANHYSSTTPEDHIGLKEMVAKLKPEHKQMIDLAYFGGYTQSEIAEEYNIPIGTVKTRMRHALQVLRNLI
jgi:RNA polymerase sigma-70 factor, ECF subfamily